MIYALVTLFVSCIIGSEGLPPNYCFEDLNTTDCGMEPTPVFMHYKPGSRCEIREWRGCPTYNRFETELTCIHMCIARFYGAHEGNDDENSIWSPSFVDVCKDDIRLEDCGIKPEKVYTFDTFNQTCTDVMWMGCPSSNMFKNESDCNERCMPVQTWKNKLKKIGLKAINNIHKALNGTINNSGDENYNPEDKPIEGDNSNANNDESKEPTTPNEEENGPTTEASKTKEPTSPNEKENGPTTEASETKEPTPPNEEDKSHEQKKSNEKDSKEETHAEDLDEIVTALRRFFQSRRRI